MLWTWYSPWLHGLRVWNDISQRYWHMLLLPATPRRPSANGADGPTGAVELVRAPDAADASPARPARGAAAPAVFGLRAGDRRAFRHTVSEAHLDAFTVASGDCNPLHLDEEYAARTRFRRRIAHGMLSASFISAALATLGGSAATTIYVSQSLRFLRPVVVGDTITTELTVRHIDPAKHRLTVETVCRNRGGEDVVAGEAVVMLDPYPFAA